MSEYLSVTTLTKYIKYKFDQDPHLQSILLKGELSNFKNIQVDIFISTLKIRIVW